MAKSEVAGRKGKRHTDAAGRYERQHQHAGTEALELVASSPVGGFDESIDLVVRLGVDPRKTEEMVRGTVALPAGTGKNVRIAVFAQGEAAAAARDAGAEHVGAEDLAAEIEGGMLDFDVAIATPDMMPTVGRLGRSLGPRGLMPNPKVGTVTFNVADAIKDLKAGRVEFRSEKKGALIQLSIGRSNFTADQLKENFLVLLGSILRAKPSSSKGAFIKSITLSSSMSPGVKVDPTVAMNEAKS